MHFHPTPLQTLTTACSLLPTEMDTTAEKNSMVKDMCKTLAGGKRG
jgi:hypothetical protein